MGVIWDLYVIPVQRVQLVSPLPRVDVAARLGSMAAPVRESELQLMQGHVRDWKIQLRYHVAVSSESGGPFARTVVSARGAITETDGGSLVELTLIAAPLLLAINAAFAIIAVTAATFLINGVMAWPMLAIGTVVYAATLALFRHFATQFRRKVVRAIDATA
jgi:hypothetical protein